MARVVQWAPIARTIKERSATLKEDEAKPHVLRLVARRVAHAFPSDRCRAWVAFMNVVAGAIRQCHVHARGWQVRARAGPAAAACSAAIVSWYTVRMRGARRAHTSSRNSSSASATCDRKTCRACPHTHTHVCAHARSG